jgi:hypothetical protein
MGVGEAGWYVVACSAGWYVVLAHFCLCQEVLLVMVVSVWLSSEGPSRIDSSQDSESGLLPKNSLDLH